MADVEVGPPVGIVICKYPKYFVGMVSFGLSHEDA